MSVINPNEVEPILVNFLLKILKQYQNILNDKSNIVTKKMFLQWMEKNVILQEEIVQKLEK